MKIKLFSTTFTPEQEKYEKFATFENELNQFIQSVKVIDIKYSTAIGMCHDAQTHVNEHSLCMRNFLKRKLPLKRIELMIIQY